MDRMATLHKRYPPLIVMGCFFVFLLVMQQDVTLYSDDFGYASLSYLQVTPGVSGPHFTLPQFFEYYRLHYLIATGRIFYTSLASIMLYFGLPAAHAVQAAMITLTAGTIAYLVSKKSALRPVLTAVIVCCLYGFFEIFLIDKSIYWFTAAAVYVYALPLTLLACYTAYEIIFENKKLSAGVLALWCACAFLNSTAHENIAVIQIFVIGMLCLLGRARGKKWPRAGLLIAVCAVAGLLFLVLSPSVSYKMGLLSQNESYTQFAALSLGERFALGIQDIIKYLFSKNFFLLTIALLLCGCRATLCLIRSRRCHVGDRLGNCAAFVCCRVRAAGICRRRGADCRPCVCVSHLFYKGAQGFFNALLHCGLAYPAAGRFCF